MIPQQPYRAENLWELVGLRMEGIPEPLLGALRFARQAPESRARRSLSSYLSSPPREIETMRSQLPPTLIRVAAKPRDLGVHAFLRRLSQGEQSGILFVDPGAIMIAFDFRRDNPSRERHRLRARSVERMIFRTRGGHVLEGNVHSFSARFQREEEFVGLGQVRQHTLTGDLELPNLIVNRRFVALVARIQEAVDSAVFEPAENACAPVIGRAAWRYFSSRAPEEASELGEPTELRVAGGGRATAAPLHPAVGGGRR